MPPIETRCSPSRLHAAKSDEFEERSQLLLARIEVPPWPRVQAASGLQKGDIDAVEVVDT